MSVGRQTKASNGRPQCKTIAELVVCTNGRLSPIAIRGVEKYWELPDRAMQEVGPAALTLAGIKSRIDGRTWETFASKGTIAREVRLSVRTVKRHVATLKAKAWIEERWTPNRKTPTLIIPRPKRREFEADFATLPRWWPRPQKWAISYVYAAILSELCKLEHAALEDRCDADEVDGRGVSIATIRDRTGVSRAQICSSIEVLVNGDVLVIDGTDSRGANIYRTPLGRSTTPHHK